MSNKCAGHKACHLLISRSLVQLMLHEQQLIAIRSKKEKQQHAEKQDDDEENRDCIHSEKEGGVILAFVSCPMFLTGRDVKEPLE